MQDLLKRLLQKNPNRRLSFDAFFSHPFLSGRPLRAPAPAEQSAHVIVEEPSSQYGTIEDDYVILSMPAPLAGALRPPPPPAASSGRRIERQSSTGSAAGRSERGSALLCISAFCTRSVHL